MTQAIEHLNRECSAPLLTASYQPASKRRFSNICPAAMRAGFAFSPPRG